MNLSKPQKLIYDTERFAGGQSNIICGVMITEEEKTVEQMTRAVNEIYRLNDGLRLRMVEDDGEACQYAAEYAPQEIKVLRFASKEALDSYAQEYAKVPFDFHGPLCEIQIVLLPEKSGILVKFHHIVGDAWTIALIGTQFNALLKGEAVEAYSYGEYVASETAYLESARCAKDKAFFLEQFEKCPEVTYFSENPTDSFAAARKTFVIDGQRARQLSEYAKEKGISPFVLFLSGFAVTMSRVKQNAEKFYIGTAVLNRTGTREKNTLGMFVNTVPLLMEIDNEKSFSDNLPAAKAAAMSALRHQKFNYGDTLATIREQYGFSEKLYDVMISYQNAAITGARGEESTWYHCGAQTESLEIHIDDRDNEGLFRIHFDYQTEKFTEAQIERIYTHFLNLLLDAIAHDDTPISRLELLSPAEKHTLLIDFNATAADYPREKCVHQLFEEQAARTPDKTAVVACDRTLTYLELNEQANCIAHGLIEKGVKPGDIVAFALHRTSKLLAAMFGILKTGAAYLPIDLDYPQERIDYMLSDSGAKLLLTDELAAELLENGNTVNPAIPMSSESLCYCIYTSGSTGKPKGVSITHQNVDNYCDNNNNNVCFHIIQRGYQSIAAVTNTVFDIFVTESLLPALNGLTIFLADDETVFSQKKLAALIEQNHVDVLQTTPTKMRSYLLDKGNVSYLKCLKAIVLGGEALPGDLYEELRRDTEAKIFNIYGPAETTVWVTNAEIQSSDDITIGKPIANTQIYIVDKYLNPVPIGVTGELCIAGDGVGAGYLNRPELTTEKFIENPFGDGKLYKTGDLAYWREDGNIAYVGRNDFQVKIRGLRIELGEIESAISSVEGISQAVVVVRKDDTGRQLICAFYTETAPVSVEKIKSAILEKLPRYMTPHIFTRLESLPMTPSGKIDRKALPEVDLSSLQSKVEYVAPETPEEKVLAETIKSVLKAERVGLLDNFFDLGGDSLKAIELIAKLEKVGLRTDTKTIFARETVKDLAAALVPAMPIEEETIPTGDIPATAAQLRVYTAQTMQGGTAYNVPYVFRAKSVDPVRLQNAVSELIDRHEILRTHFENRDGEIMQVAEDSVPFTLERLESADILAFVRPFDLSKAPLLRVGYFENTVLIDMHHIITDGGSMPVFLHELNELYMGRELKDSPVPYRAFAAQKQDFSLHEDYWLSVYREELPELALNTDFKRDQKQSFQGAAVYDSIDRDLHSKILAKCKSLNITPYVFYLSSFYILLSKFSGNEDIAVGTPASGREGKFLNTLGMFVNTLVIRNKPEGKKSIADFLREVKESSLAALEHQAYPYGDLVKKLDLQTQGRNPLFDVMFAYQSEEMTEVTFGDQPAELLPVPVTTAKYDFTFNILPRQNDVVAMVEYCTDLYREETVRRFLNGYKLILSQMLNESQQLKAIFAIDETERQKLLFDFNDTAADYPREKCVHQLFEEQAEKTPDKTAVVACDRTLTYRELNEQANRIAHGLLEKGVKPGDIVAFALHRTSKLLAAMFGILKAGAAYLPIDLDYPQERIDYMLSDSGAKLLLTDELAAELLENRNAENPAVPMTSESLCYCIYTSGSTGKPKGTLLTHKGVVNLCAINYSNKFQQTLAARCSTLLSIGAVVFDIFSFEVLPSIVKGLSLILATESDLLSPTALSRLMRQYSVDGLFCTPTKLEMYLRQSEFALALKSAKVIIVAGEQFSTSQYEKLASMTRAEIINGYGPSETTMGVCFGEVTSADIHIGKPIANTQIYIVDRYLNPVPIGVTGELCIAGDGVGAGYLNRPELTTEKFIENPFGEGKLYKTGDLAYWREDGNIAYVGRNDFQVKIRGLRIELGEIESAISSVDGISQAVVVVRKDGTGRQLICAFYTETESVPVERIKGAILAKLPRYMTPHIFTRLESLPMTPSGKIDRKALPEVDLSSLQSEVEYVAPETLAEKVLAETIKSVLKTERVGLLDNFFDLGGDSLKAIELIAKLEKAGLRTDTKTIFARETVKDLAAALVPVTPAEEEAIPTGNIPATAAQLRVYTAQTMQGGTAYNVPYVFRVKSVDPVRLQNAVSMLIDRHEILRTHFENRDGEIMQVAESHVEFAVEKLATDDILAFVRPFDLSKVPLLRVGYYENTVLIDMHHIITDGGSMPVFLHELNELYMGRELKDSPVPYCAFAAEKQDMTAHEDYWLSVYREELPELALNTDLKRGQKQSFRGAAVYDSVDRDLHSKILAKCKALNITPFVFYLSGFYILLSKFSGNEDIAVGTPASGREGKFLNTLGMFVNTLAIRNRPEGEKSISDFLREVKESSLAALEHQAYPYGDLVKKLGLQTQGRNPLFDVMFAYQSEEMTEVTFGDQPAELLPVPVTTAKYDFTFNILPRQNDVVAMVEYCTDLYKEQTILRLLNGYKLILTQMLHEGQQLKAISAMGETEKRTLLIDFNNTAADYPREKCVHQLFEEQVEKTPDKTAVVACDRTLTYRELNEQANRIANGLIEKGVKPGDIVAFALHRTCKLLAAMFGILKAGAAYLPIDLDYPQERIDYMLSDSGAKLLLTDELAAELLENENTENPGIYVGAREKYCIIYTSGSTGHPKGCILLHQGVSNFCINSNVMRYFDGKGIAPVGISLNNVTFDYFIAENMVLLLHGYTTILCNEMESISPDKFWTLCEKHQANLIQTTPTKYRIMLDSPKCEYLKSIVLLVTSGEPLTQELISEFRKHTAAEIFNPLGPSEATVWSPNGENITDGDIHIGKPIANTQIYIVDKYLNPVPIGVTGELCIAGDGVGAGYLNRPELTAEKFIPNPFGKGKLYKTGDLAYWREDGNIAYVGRNDFQVKIRGLRIELGEIESTISSVEGVSQAVVVVRKDDTGRQLICTFYTETAPVSVEKIKSAILEKLPRYMTPHIFTRLDALPMTPSGKIDRKALPEVDLSHIQLETEYVKPEGELETSLANLMGQVLHYAPVGREDNFFDLGGDSLKAIEFVSKAHNEGIYFSLQTVFDQPTVAELTQAIQSGDKPAVSYADVDFGSINKILQKNRIELASVPPKTKIGNLLLAGATGFLGIHILADFLEHDSGTAYCLVRGKDQANSENRMASLLRFYFGEKYTGCDRVKVLRADLQEDRFGLSAGEYDSLLSYVDTVINAAASVKHYGSYQYFYEVNVETVKRLIDFCRSAQAKLLHISTLSVSGNSNGDNFDGYVSPEEKHFYESDLYIGQPLENVYARSKFEAEKAVLEGMADGLKANILRMGNLINRLSDGVFQINHETNAAAQRFKGMLELGCVPEYLLDMYVEFTPIDEAADAVMTIARHFSTEQTVFHINSTKVVFLDRLLEYLKQLGYPMQVVDGKTFTTALRQSAKEAGTEHIFETFINDLDTNDRLNYESNIHIENSFTEEYLHRLGFRWSEIGLEYLRKYMAYFEGIGYFEKRGS